MRTLSFARSWHIAALLFALTGCSSETALYQVSGSVKYDGQPLPAGVIYFNPDPTTNRGAQGYAIIKNGEFNTAKDGGRGVTSGHYSVRIEGFDGSAGRELPLGKLLFSQFEQSLLLPKSDSRQDFDVPANKK